MKENRTAHTILAKVPAALRKTLRIKTPALAALLVLALSAGLVMGAGAAGTRKQVTAYEDYGITIKLDGEVQIPKNANGDRVYPLSYSGTTYLPIRAVGNMLDIGVDWDQASRTVLLGVPAGGVDLIETYKPIAGYTKEHGMLTPKPEFIQSVDKQTREIGGETVSHWISSQLFNRLGYSFEPGPCTFNLDGKYTTLTFKVFSEKDVTLYVKGDNDAVLNQYSIKGGQVPQTCTVNLLNTTQLSFLFEKLPGLMYNTVYGEFAYIFDAKVS